MFDTLKEREKNILAILSLALTVALFFIVVKPQIDKKSENLEEIKKLQAALKKPKVKKEDIDALLKEINALKTSISTLKAQVPKTEKRGFLIRDLEELAKSNKIELISFMPKEAIAVTLGGQEINEKMKRHLKRKKRTTVKGKVLKTVINIDSSGLFKDYKKLFSDIIRYYRAVEVADVVISRAGVKAQGVDKRFAQKSRGDDLLTQFKDQNLNVSFTLYAYTSLES